jgi:hypothetical protein
MVLIFLSDWSALFRDWTARQRLYCLNCNWLIAADKGRHFITGAASMNCIFRSNRSYMVMKLCENHVLERK